MSQKTRILLVEDNTALLESLELDLDLRGYDVLTASDGKAAIKLLESLDTLPDIIVSDIAMPNMDGYQLLEAMNEYPQWKRIPFIFLTALGSETHIRKGKSMGVDDYLVKPFQPQDLVVAIENKFKRVNEFRKFAEHELDNVRSELMQLISHELLTPLTSMYMGTELLAQDLESFSDDDSKKALQIIQGGARRMHRLIHQVLFLAQFDSGTLRQEIEKRAQPCQLQELIQVAINNLQYEMNYEFNIHLHLPEENVMVNGMHDTLVMLFSEIIRNAVNFSHSADDEIEITLTTHEDQAVISIADQGVGIAVRDQEKVWERFIQSERGSMEQQGGGLGLTIARACVQLHNGTCTLESRLNAGTTVIITLPTLS